MTSQQDKTPEQVLDDFALNYTTEYTSIESKLERGVIDIKQAHSRKEIAYQEALAEAIQALTSWKDKEVERAIEIHDLENAVERLDVQCSEGKCKNCDSKRPRLKEIQERLESLQSQGGK